MGTIEAEPILAELSSPPVQPGSWRSALYRADAPGAVLDAQPWARSWRAYLRAITDPNDGAARTLIANVMSERVPSEGGFLVPELLRSEVLAYMTSAVVRPHAMVLPMASLRLPVPVLDNPDQSAGQQALGGLTFSVTEEGAAIPASTPTFGRVVLEARKIAAYLQGVPDELVDDAAGAWGDFLARVIGTGYAWAEDDLFFNGTGTGQPEGLISAGCQVTAPRAADDLVQLTDIVAMYKALHPASKQKATLPGRSAATWLLSAAAMDQILELFLTVDPSGTAPAAQIPVAPSEWFSAGNDETGASILGMPAVITDHQPALGTTGDVVLADLSNYLIGDRLTMTVERSQQGAGFISGTSNFRVRTRVDGRYWIQSPSTTEAGQQVSPVVVLGPAAG